MIRPRNASQDFGSALIRSSGVILRQVSPMGLALLHMELKADPTRLGRSDGPTEEDYVVMFVSSTDLPGHFVNSAWFT